jgi:hypothetical protein
MAFALVTELSFLRPLHRPAKDPTNVSALSFVELPLCMSFTHSIQKSSTGSTIERFLLFFRLSTQFVAIPSLDPKQKLRYHF